MRAIQIILVFSFILAIPLMAKDKVQIQSNTAEQNNSKTTKESPLVLTVYKNENCGCCNKWIAHLHENNIHVKAIDVDDMGLIKSQYHIKPYMRSCHTAVSDDGFVFEGHVPAKYIKRFLSEKHTEQTIGLAVPAMPLGTPGMEMEGMFHKYNIELLTEDRNRSTYEHISKYIEQF